MDGRSLAHEVAMSRSAFSARFSEAVGEPVMTYVTRWRMQLGESYLREGLPVSDAAERLGYESDAAFSRAFKRVTGVPPGSVARAKNARAYLRLSLVAGLLVPFRHRALLLEGDGAAVHLGADLVCLA